MEMKEVFELFYFIGVNRRVEYEDSIIYDFMVDPVNVVVYNNEVLNEIKEQVKASEVELITRGGSTIIRFIFAKEKKEIKAITQEQPQEPQKEEPKETEPEGEVEI